MCTGCGSKLKGANDDDLIKRADVITAIRKAETWSEFHFAPDWDRARQYIDKLPSIDRPQKWISCSEKLPEKKAQKYLIYYQDYLNGGFDYAVVPYLRTPYGWEFEFYNESNNCEAIAWMPLPKPYMYYYTQGR